MGNTSSKGKNRFRRRKRQRKSSIRDSESHSATEAPSHESMIAATKPEHTLRGDIMFEYNSKPSMTSEHALTQEAALKKSRSPSQWLRCSHSVNEHKVQLNQHTIVFFGPDGEASMIHAYDSSQDTHTRYHAASMDPKLDARFVTAAAHSFLNILYAVISIEKDDKLKRFYIVSFDFNAKRWEQVATIPSPVWIPGACDRIRGALVVADALLIISSDCAWVYDVSSTSHEVCFQRLLSWEGGGTSLLGGSEIDVFFLPRRSRVLLVAHGLGMFTFLWEPLRPSTSNIIRLAQVPLWLSGDGLRSPLQAPPERSGCIVTVDGGHVLLFTESGRIWVVSTRSWCGRASEIKCPIDSRGMNGLYAWKLGNTGTATVNWFVRAYHEQYPDDLVRMICSYVGTWFVHLFMRNRGHHWACPLRPILCGEDATGRPLESVFEPRAN